MSLFEQITNTFAVLKLGSWLKERLPPVPLKLDVVDEPVPYLASDQNTTIISRLAKKIVVV
jgi:hypothetical protein